MYSSGFNLVEPWRSQVGETFTNFSFSLQNHSWGGLTLICFQPMLRFRSAWCQDEMMNLSAISCQFFFCMFIYLWQMLDDSFLIWMDQNQNKPHSSYLRVCSDWMHPPPSYQQIKITPSLEPQIGLSDIMIFIPALNLLNMLRLVPDSLLLWYSANCSCSSKVGVNW